MKKILALPKYIFESNFTNKEIEYYSYACFISILDLDNNENKYNKNLDNFLQVKMWDIEQDVYLDGKLKYSKPSTTEIKRIVWFINKHKDKSVFIIHCSAGISRSGAVAMYDKNRLIFMLIYKPHYPFYFGCALKMIRVPMS